MRGERILEAPNKSIKQYFRLSAPPSLSSEGRGGSFTSLYTPSLREGWGWVLEGLGGREALKYPLTSYHSPLTSNKPLTSLFLHKCIDISQIPPQLVVVESVAHDEVVGNLHGCVLHVEVHL